ncbi:MAG: electron transfer flavoprotein subunit beta/FixA family protein [Candidatus Thermoplasmatota archaeon]
MNIIVCMKQVPDTETRIKLKNGKIDLEGAKYVVNPYDEFAVEEAIKIKEKFGGFVKIVNIGPKRAEEAIRTCFAMGADDAIHFETDKEIDAYATAKALAQIIKELKYDIIFTGKYAVDDDSTSVASMLAEFLGIPNVNVVNKVEIIGNKVRVNRQIEGGEEVFEANMPILLSAQKGLNIPRYPTLPNIIKAKKKEIKKVNFPLPESKTNIIDISLPPERKGAKLIEGKDPKEIAVKLLNCLKTEAKIL